MGATAGGRIHRYARAVLRLSQLHDGQLAVERRGETLVQALGSERRAALWQRQTPVPPGRSSGRQKNKNGFVNPPFRSYGLLMSGSTVLPCKENIADLTEFPN